MSLSERQKQFRAAVEALPSVRKADARIAENFGFSNSSRVLEGGLFACTNNLETYSRKLLGGVVESSQFVLLCVLTFPPQDEVYFAILVSAEADRVNRGLATLARQVEARNASLAVGKKPSTINNNVKFYITKNGNLYFENEFRDSISEPDLAPDLLARVDSISFSIWPADASASRSLLAREFVGYLGSLIGRERVHELRVWQDESAVSADMQRLPTTIPVANIEAAVAAMGGHYPGGEVRRFHAALNFLPYKHFVILAGLSGTGKTQLALKYARAVHGLGASGPDPFLFICPVRPEWTDPTGLTGYYDVLSNRYMVPPFLEAVLLATAHRNSPVFVVLDEMNLARVEYYFSDVLSAIETREALQLHEHGVPLEGSTGTSIPAQLPLPSNLYITGTINIDETTNPVSDKVLDRAVVIDMTAVDLDGFLATLEEHNPSLRDARVACAPHLLAAQAVMATHGLGFGYRVAEEVIRYHAFAAEHLGMKPEAITDDLMVQKVLVKLRGSARQQTLLSGLSRVLGGLPRSQTFLAKLQGDLEEFGSFQASR